MKQASDPDTLEAELTTIAQALANNPDQTDLQNAYDNTLSRLSNSDPGKIQALLANFNLHQLNENQLVGTLSGGKKQGCHSFWSCWESRNCFY